MTFLKFLPIVCIFGIFLILAYTFTNAAKQIKTINDKPGDRTCN